MSAGSIIRYVVITIFAVMLFALISGAGCNSPNTAAGSADRSASAVSSMDDLRHDALSGRRLVDQTMETLNTLQTSDNLRATFDTYSKQVDEIKADGEKIRNLNEQMRTRVQEYVQKWQEQMSEVTDPSLKNLAEQRRAAVEKRYEEVRAHHKALGDAYTAFYGDLTNIRTYLGNDLTPTGVKAVDKTITKANQDRETMKVHGDALLKALDEMSAGMATPKPANI